MARALVLASLWLASAGGPLGLSDAGPHVHYGWGESIRLRHLYTSGPHGPSSCFLRIRVDGAVDCARGQSAHSECPPGPPPAQGPLLPSPPSTPAGSPLPATPGFSTSSFCTLPGSPDSVRTGGGGTAPWTYHTHGLLSPDPPPLWLLQTLHSWEFQDLAPRRLTPSLGPQQREEMGEMGAGYEHNHVHISWVPRPRLQLFASLASGLVEIRAVALRKVAIKGVHSARYLCMEGDGRMRGLVGVANWREALGPGPAGRGRGAGSDPGFPGFPPLAGLGAPRGGLAARAGLS